MRLLTTAILILALLSVGACTGPVQTTPVLTLQPLPSPVPSAPVLDVAVIDWHSAGDASYANQFASFIRNAYGPAVRIVDPNSPSAGRVTLEIRIVELGAVRNRRRDTHVKIDIESVAAIGNVGDWSKVLAAAPLRGPPVSGKMVVRRDTGQAIPNNWSGIAHMEIKVDDLRRGHSAAFRQPFYSEHVAPGAWDQLTGMALANDAWDDVEPRIAAFLDAAMRKVISEQAVPPPSARK